MEKTKKSYFNIVGGVIFIILALLNIFLFLHYLRYGGMWWRFLISIIAYITISIPLFLRSKKLWPILVGFILLSICQLIYCIIGTIRYLDPPKFMGSNTGINSPAFVAHLTTNLFAIGANIFAVVITILTFKEDTRRKEKIKKLWFVPTILSVLSIVIILIFSAIKVYILNGVFIFLQFTYVFYIVGILFAMMWIAYPNGFNKNPVESLEKI
ncbi:MAG: hypothetical protein J1F31_05120 [Erysipelotrichales bacterium]|nr:hypothetical protein [Erysipelotrichales bacterium]